MTQQNLDAFIGDSVELVIALSWAGVDFEPAEEWTLIFTAKASADDEDSAAIFQKASGAGIEVTGSTATVSLVPDDTEDLADADKLLFDIQAQNITTGKLRTVAFGDIYFARDITRDAAVSIPIYTTEEYVSRGEAGATGADGADGADGATTFAALTDKVTASIATTNTSVADALAGRATLSGESGNLFENDNTFKVGTVTTIAGQLTFTSTTSFDYSGTSQAAHRTALGLGTLATQSGTFSGTSSGTNTGDETSASISSKIGTFTTPQAAAARTGMDAEPVANPKARQQTYLIHEKFLGMGLNDPITTVAAGIISGAKDRICFPGPGKLTFTYGTFSGTRVLDGLQYVVNSEAGNSQWVHSQTKHTIVAGLALITKFTANSYSRDGISIGWGNGETSCDSAGVSINQSAIDGTQNVLSATTLYAAGSGLYNTVHPLSRFGLEDGETYRIAVEWKTTTQIRIWIQGGTWAATYGATLDSDRWFPLIDHKVQATNPSLYALVGNYCIYGNSILKMQEFSVVQHFSPSPDLMILDYNEVGSAAHIPAILPLSDGTEIATWQKGTADATSDQALWGAVRISTGWTAPQSLIASAGDNSILQNGSLAIINDQIWWTYMRSDVLVNQYIIYFRVITISSLGVISLGPETEIAGLGRGYLAYGPPLQTPTGRILLPLETYDTSGPRAFTAATSDICTSVAHGLSTGEKVLVNSDNALPAGLVTTIPYYVIRVTNDTFKLASSYANAIAGTPAVDITGTGTGTHSIYRHVFTAATTDICTSTAHGYQTGYHVSIFANGSAPGGLTTATYYYIIRLSSDTFSLASTHANAIAGTAVDISSAGTGVYAISGYQFVHPAQVRSDDDGATWTLTNYGSTAMPGHTPDEHNGYNAEMTYGLEPSGTTLRAITRTSTRATSTNPANPAGMSLTATSTDDGTTWSTFEPYSIPQTIGGASADAGQRVTARQMPDGRILAFGSDDQLNRRRLTAWIIGNNGRIDDQMLFANTPEKARVGNQQYPDGFYKNGYLHGIWADKTFGGAAPNAKSAIVYVAQKWRSGRVRDTMTPAVVPYPQHYSRATVARTVALVDAATIALNADEGNVFSVLLTSGVGATRIIGNPSNPTDGQEIKIRIRQASDTGSRAVTLASSWRNALTLTVSASANATNYLTAIYDGKDSKWDVIAWN